MIIIVIITLKIITMKFMCCENGFQNWRVFNNNNMNVCMKRIAIVHVSISKCMWILTIGLSSHLHTNTSHFCYLCVQLVEFESRFEMISNVLSDIDGGVDCRRCENATTTIAQIHIKYSTIVEHLKELNSDAHSRDWPSIQWTNKWNSHIKWTHETKIN